MKGEDEREGREGITVSTVMMEAIKMIGESCSWWMELTVDSEYNHNR